MRIETEAGCAGRRAKAPDASPRDGPAIGGGSERTVGEPNRRDTVCCCRMPTRARSGARAIAHLNRAACPRTLSNQLTVSRETHDKFRRAQALLRHAVPSGDAAEIFNRAVTLLVDQLEHQRFAQTERARATKPSPGPSRHIPAAVRRAVWRRDGGCCAFIGTEGRCGERAFLELHHVSSRKKIRDRLTPWPMREPSFVGCVRRRGHSASTLVGSSRTAGQPELTSQPPRPSSAI